MKKPLAVVAALGTLATVLTATPVQAAPAVLQLPAIGHTAERQPASLTTRRLTPNLRALHNRARLRIVRYARSQRGRMYRYGGRTDCSGLTMWSYRQVGIRLPHKARSQARYGVAVPLSHAKFGDIVTFGSPVHHVAIYLGHYGGHHVVIHAPGRGRRIQYAIVWSEHTHVRKLISG